MLRTSYITREMVQRALKRMKEFHEAQIDTHKKFGMDFVANRGRRNIIMSAAQERFFADAIAREFKDVTEDGRTGQPDIHIGELSRELECKMTSPLVKTGAIQLQTDYETLVQKGKLDYLYVIASADFNSFCVLHFLDLTSDDYREPHATARGKVAMVKHKGMSKCTVLWGNVETQIDRSLVKLTSEMEAVGANLDQEIREIAVRKATLESALASDMHPETGEKLKARSRRSLREMLKRLETRPTRITAKAGKKLEKLSAKILEVQAKKPQFTFNLEPV